MPVFGKELKVSTGLKAGLQTVDKLCKAAPVFPIFLKHARPL
jgi:hypothetical protein